jgi:hypothetical protein
MPIPNKRLVVVGVKVLQAQFKDYVELRQSAEREAKAALPGLADLEREAERAAREAEEPHRG